MDVEQAAPGKPKYRGKLYALSDQSAWEDTGTGYCTVTPVGDGKRLIFADEETGEVLHDRPLFSSDIYQLQGDGDRQTIIVWEDPESQKDWALSFQDPDGTAEIWEAISGGAENQPPEEKRILPLPKLGGLGELARMLTCVPPSAREALAQECLSAIFLESLLEAFHTAEDLGSEDALAHLWQITKGIFLLSNQKLTERYLKDDVYEDILGMLEYDAGLPPSKRTLHRQVLKMKVQFKQAVDFEDAEVLERIHLNYRLQYLKDIVLPRLLDDGSFVSLTQMIHANLSVILDSVKTSAKVLDQLFQQLQRRDLNSLLFLQDVCRLTRQIPPGERAALYEKMIERQLFPTLLLFFTDSTPTEEAAAEVAVPGSNTNPRHLAVEIMLISCMTDPSHLRRFMCAEGSVEGRGLLNGIIRLILVDQDQGVQSQASEVIKSIMDKTNLEHQERDSSLDVFYEAGALDELMEPLRRESGRLQGDRPSDCFGQQICCELLSFAIMQHGYRAKTYVMRHGTPGQAARLFGSPHRFLQLAPIRLVRAMVISKDDVYHRYVVKNGLFAPMLNAFQQCLRPPALGGNLLVSAVLEVLDVIRVENIKVLIDHVCRKHGDLLRGFAPRFRCLEGLLLKHQQNLEYEAFPPERHGSGAGGPAPQQGPGHMPRTKSGRVRSPGRDDSDEDESYFESLEDDDDDGAPPATSAEGAAGGAPAAPKSEAPSQPSPRAPAAGGAATEDAAKSTDGSEKGAEEGLKGLLGDYDEVEEEASAPKAEDFQAEEAAPPAETNGNGSSPAEEKDAGASAATDDAEAATENARPGSPKQRPADELAEAAAGEASADAAASKGLNHVAKRLKTAASAEAEAA